MIKLAIADLGAAPACLVPAGLGWGDAHFGIAGSGTA